MGLFFARNSLGNSWGIWIMENGLGLNDAFCLKWNDYQKSVSESFAELRSDTSLVDVTIVCEGVHFPAHRLVLSACSAAFKELFAKGGKPVSLDTMVMLWDVTADDMNALFSFMYEGQVNVKQERLNIFLGLAERLQVKGLTRDESPTAEEDEIQTIEV